MPPSDPRACARADGRIWAEPGVPPCETGAGLAHPGRRSPAERRSVAAVALLLALLGLSAGCEVVWDKKESPSLSTWTPQSGWSQVEPGEPSASAAAIRAEARKAFDAEEYTDALLGLQQIVSEFPDSQEAREAYTLFLIAECHFNLGSYEAAYEHYQKTLSRRPSDSILNQSLSRIYDIGLAYLHGIARRSFLGFRYRSPTFGVDILIGERGLVTLYPFLEYSDVALWQVSNYYFKKREYPEAEQVLEQLVRDYPLGEWHEAAEYLLALSVFEQVRGEDYDQEPLKKAKRKFNLYRTHYPRGSRIPEAQEKLRQLAEMEARHDLKVAKYYLRESRPEAAMYYLRSVLLNNPTTDAAAEAREIYRQMARFRGEDEESLSLESGSS